MSDPAVSEALASEAPRRGRPRSAASERAILQAALDMMGEGQPPESISIAEIARRAGAGKDTIYRRWQTKDDLLVDALASQLAEITVDAERGLRDVLVELLTDMIGRLQRPRDRRILQSLRGAGGDFPKLKQRYYEQVVSRRHALVRQWVEEAETRGELKPGTAVSGIMRMPFDHVLMSALDEKPIVGDPRQAAERLTDAVLAGVASAS
jgi:AcrR family transcriptional regulator